MGRSLFSRFLLISLLLVISGITSAAPSAVQLPAVQLIDELKVKHHEALQLSLSSPEKGRKAHARVASRLETLAGNPEVNQATLAYNIGNSWFLAGHYGYSVLWFRKSQQLNDHDIQLKQSLDYVRSQRVDNLPNAFGTLWVTSIYSWVTSIPWYCIILVINGLFWWQLWRFFKFGQKYSDGLAGLSVCLLIVLASQLFRVVYSPEVSSGVIVAREVIARKGPGLIYSTAFNAPLNQGTEFIDLQTEKNWSEVTLSNGQKGWLPNSAVQAIENVEGGRSER